MGTGVLPNPHLTEQEGQNSEAKAWERKALIVFSFLLALSFLALILVGVSGLFTSPSSFGTAAVLYSLAFFCLGGLLGFLFGIPRTYSRTAEDDPQEESRRRTEVNTNLVQISDWLTKIIVGVTLVQLNEAPEFLKRYNNFAGSAFIGSGTTAAVASLLFFSTNGFLLGYLATRLILQGAFYSEDKKLEDKFQIEIGKIKKGLTQTVSDVVQSDKKQNEQNDHSTYEIVQNFLFSAQPPDEALKRSLLEVIKLATVSAKEKIYDECRDERKDITQPADKTVSEEDRTMLERTIDIFEALQKADDKYRDDYRVFAEIGYAYEGLGRILGKDVAADRKAEKALTEAIELRDKQGRRNLYYEFYRAIVRIRLEGKSPSINVRKDIESDLRKAGEIQPIRERIEKVQVIKEWLEKNNLSLDSV